MTNATLRSYHKLATRPWQWTCVFSALNYQTGA